MSQNGTLTSGLEQLVAEIHATTKQASATKKAEPISEPGSIGGASSHPTAKAEDGLQKATEGARSSENETDVKGLPQGNLTPNSTPEVTDRQDEVQRNMGMTQSATGEDPSVEDNYKGDKDDPGTSHPAKTDDGEKYGSWSIEKLAAAIGPLGNELLADVATGRFSKQASPAPQAAAAAPATTTAKAVGDSPPATEKAAAEGYELASLLGIHGQVSDSDIGRQLIINTVKEAQLSADLAAEYLRKFAAEDEAEGEDHDKPGDESSGASDSGSSDGKPAKSDGGGDKGAPPPGAGGPPSDGGGAPPPDAGGAPPPAAGGAGGGDPLAALLGGGGGAAPPPAPGGMGAPAPGGAPGGMGAPGAAPGSDPLLGAMSGMAPAPGGAPGMGGPSPDEVLQQLAAAMLEFGIDPQQMAASMATKTAGTKWASVDVVKLAQQVTEFKRAGKFAFREPKTAREQDLRNSVRSFLAELS